MSKLPFCFFMCYDSMYAKTAQGLVNSIKKFYPDAPIFEFDVPRNGDFNLKAFCDFHLERGKELLEEFDRIISLDPDEIMCAECPDLFGDFDLGVIRNNIPFEIPSESPKGNIYVNAGLTICTNPETWQTWMDYYHNRCIDFPDGGLNEQNALNDVFHKSPYKISLLEYPDRVYGISAMDFGYPNMFVKNNELWLKWKIGERWHEKKLCLFHAAGVDWKDKPTGEIKFDMIADTEARDMLKGLTYGS